MTLPSGQAIRMADRVYGRIRVRQDQATLLLRLLHEERQRVSKLRIDYKEIEPSTTPGLNRATALIDATKNEIWRLIEEQGWDIDGKEA